MSAQFSHEITPLGTEPEGPAGEAIALVLVPGESSGEKNETTLGDLSLDVPMLGVMIVRKFELSLGPMGPEVREATRREARTYGVRLLLKTYGVIPPGANDATDKAFADHYKEIEASDDMADRRAILDLADRFESHPTQVAFDFIIGQTTDAALRENMGMMRKASLLLLRENNAG